MVRGKMSDEQLFEREIKHHRKSTQWTAKFNGILITSFEMRCYNEMV